MKSDSARMALGASMSASPHSSALLDIRIKVNTRVAEMPDNSHLIRSGQGT